MKAKTAHGKTIKKMLEKIKSENKPMSKIVQYLLSEDDLGLEIVDMRAVLK